MKKFVVMPFGYEYNDNTYDREGFVFENARHFDTIEDANEERIKMTEKRIPELNDSYRDVTMCMEHSDANKVSEYFGNSSCYDNETNLEELSDSDKKEVLQIIAPYVYEIVEIDTDEDSGKVEYEDSYSKMEYNMKLNENGEVVMHSLDGPAFKRDWTDWDDELDEKYYIDGESMEKEEWKVRKREHKIDQVVED